jgi:putative ABC transport system permease protein
MSWMGEMWRRAGMLVRRERFWRELEEEMREHREMRARELRESGVSEEQARYRAAREFGNAMWLKEESWAGWGWNWLVDFTQDARFGMRLLGKSPGFVAVAVITLALGIGANTAIFSVVKAVLLNRLPYRAPEQLVTLAGTDSHTTRPTNVAYMEVMDWKERSHTLRSVAMYHGWGPTLSGTGKPEILRGMQATHEFFETLGVEPMLGRDFQADEDRPGRNDVVLLGYGFWKERFGGRLDAVGSTVQLNFRAYRIIGVLPESFRGQLFSQQPREVQIWAPLGYDAALPDACRSCQHLRGVARLAEAATLEQARADLNAAAAQAAREYPKDYAHDAGVVVLGLRDKVIRDVRLALWVLMGATGLVLLIACVNVASLMLGRASARRAEMALRAALGASQRRLRRQLLTESAVLSLLGAAAGVALAQVAIEALVKWGPQNLPRIEDVHVDAGVLAFTVAMAMITAMGTGIAPSLGSARTPEREALQESRSTESARRSGIRNLLVAGEVALALVLTAGAGLLLKSLMLVLGMNAGFDMRDLYTTNVALIGPKYKTDASVTEFWREALAKVRGIQGVESAAFVSTLPLGNDYDQRGFHRKDRVLASSSEAPSVDGYWVSSDYFAVMKIPVLRGRGFTEADEANAQVRPVAVISESTAREMFRGEDALGKAIQLGGRNEKKPWATVVGIVGDVRQYGLDTELRPAAYLCAGQDPLNYATVVVRSGVTARTLTKRVEKEIAAIDADVPVYGAATMEELVSAGTTERRFVATLIGGFGALALTLAGVGVFGVAAYGVARRTSEIGIRMALGAPRWDVAKMVLRGAIWQTGAGVLIGVPIALGGGRALAHELFQVKSYDPAVLGASVTLLLAAAVVASVAPAMRAASVDPMRALRMD